MADAGLPPCVRGNLMQMGYGVVRERSTPVCTGKSEELTLLQTIEKVYPRVYGEILDRQKAADLVQGLPPCVRGNPQQSNVKLGETGSTPVCTGKSN